MDDQSHNHPRNQSEVFNWLVIAATKPKDILLVETEDRRKQGLIQDERGASHITYLWFRFLESLFYASQDEVSLEDDMRYHVLGWHGNFAVYL